MTTKVNNNDLISHRKCITNTEDILSAFLRKIDISKLYTIDEYHTILTNAYSENVKDKKKAFENHIFMKNKLLELKTQNPDKKAEEMLKMAVAELSSNKI